MPETADPGAASKASLAAPGALLVLAPIFCPTGAKAPPSPHPHPPPPVRVDRHVVVVGRRVEDVVERLRTLRLS